jgi:hypothetical protein
MRPDLHQGYGKGYTADDLLISNNLDIYGVLMIGMSNL